jgi:uncharacterized protein YggL (DUF469 family)
MRRIAKLILFSVLAATMVVGTAGVALADDGQSNQGKQDGLLARVAQILNIDLQKLKDAFKQALTESHTEKQNTELQNLVNSGKLTQNQADQLKAWLDSRPDIPGANPGNLDQLLKDGKITQAQYDSFKAWVNAKPDVPLPQRQGGQGPDAGLQKLVENGKLTQEQADTFKAWLDSRPDIAGVNPGNLDQALKDGKITQAQYDAFKAWLAAKPDIQLPPPPARGHQGGRMWQRFQGTQNPQPEANPTTY